MAITFVLTEVTPDRVRYICTSDGTSSQSPDTGILVNRLGATPDLRTDSLLFRGSPINVILSTAVADQAEARQNMFGDFLNLNTDIEFQRCCVTINSLATVTTGANKWSVDAYRGSQIDAGSTVFPVFFVSGPLVAGATASLEINFVHTYDR